MKLETILEKQRKNVLVWTVGINQTYPEILLIVEHNYVIFLYLNEELIEVFVHILIKLGVELLYFKTFQNEIFWNVFTALET